MENIFEKKESRAEGQALKDRLGNEILNGHILKKVGGKYPSHYRVMINGEIYKSKGIKKVSIGKIVDGRAKNFIIVGTIKDNPILI